MSVFRSLSISNKLAVIFLVLLVMMGVGGSVGLYNATKIADVTKELYQDSFVRTETLTAIEREFIGERQELLLHIIVRSEGSRSFLRGTILEHRSAIDRLISDFKGFDVDMDTLLILEDFEENLVAYHLLENKVIELSAAGQTIEAMKLVEADATRRFNNSINALRKVIEWERSRAALSYLKTDELSRIIVMVTLIFTLAAIVMAAGLWFAVTRSIVKPILSIEDSAKKISEGNLSHRAEVLSGDEIGSLAMEFNKMAENLQEYYETLERKVEERTEELRVANVELQSKKRELEDKNEELARASRMKSQFLANVSHELRTPLNSIIGFSELLQEKSFGELTDKQGQYVKFIHASGEHLLQLINSILDLSKIEAGRMELSQEDTLLTDIIGEVLGTIRPLALKRRITVKSKVLAASPIIRVDKGKFKQVLFNLLSNAVKFNIEGGSVYVDWEIKEEPMGMEISRFLYLSVEDTGEGIKQEDLKRLFKEFEQLETTSTKEHGGTGLGLALTKKLVELHGGKIWVESEYGRGCKFTLKIPQGTGELVVEPFDNKDIDEEGGGLGEIYNEKPLVLIAGESEEINNLLKIYIGDEFEVAMAGDGEELLVKARSLKPFAIITGVSLEKKDGWDVLKEIKEDNEISDIPVVIVSSSNKRELGFSLGAVEYLEKPVDKDKLMNTLARLNFTPVSQGGVFKVLAIDDEPAVLELLNDILSKEGFAVEKARGGKEGIDSAVNNTPDLIILDLMMPEVTGFDVVEELRSHPIAKEIPIIVFTAKDLDAEDKRRLGTDIEKVVQKAGFSKDDLLSQIRLLEVSYPNKAKMINPTTGFFNKRYLEIMLPREVSRSTRYNQRFALMMVGMDNLSQLGESEPMDEVRRKAGKFIARDLRRADIVMDYSEDKFVIFLPGISDKDAVAVAEKLCDNVAGQEIGELGAGGGSFKINVAIKTLPSDKKSDIVADLEKTLDSLRLSEGKAIGFCGE